MKIKFLVILFFISFLTTSQTIKCTHNLNKYVGYFLNESAKRGVDGFKILSNIKVLIAYDIEYPKLLGYYRNNELFLNDDILENEIKSKIVFLHEIGHAVGLKHSCVDCLEIMSVYYDVKKEREYKKNLKRMLDVYFRKIKKHTK